jgi:phage tail tape-measure protein
MPNINTRKRGKKKMPEEVQQPKTVDQAAPPVIRQSTLVGAGIGAAWGVLGGPVGIAGGALVGGVIGHFWGARIVKGLKKALEEEDEK